MENIFKATIDGENFELRIRPTDYPESPRDWDINTSHLYCWSKRYFLGDVNPYDSLLECLEDLVNKSSLSAAQKKAQLKLLRATDDQGHYSKAAHEQVMQYLGDHGGILVRYIYLYSHSDICISLNDFNDRWDSGIVGLAVVFKNELPQPMQTEKDWYVNATQVLNAEFDLYAKYIEGDVWSFSLVKIKECPCCKQIVEEHIDSCGGFFGTDWSENGLFDQMDKKYADAFIKEVK